MHKIDPIFTSAWPRTLSVRSLSSLSLVLFSLPTVAQAPRVLVSTTDDVTPGVLPFAVTDTDLVAVGGGKPVLPDFMGGHFQATCGFTPTDIDAVTRFPGTRPGRLESLVFSLLSNEGGFLDGDILGLAPGGGTALLVSELDLANAMGAPGANIDVDALTYDDQGRLLFSLFSDQTGTSLGTILDGDILRLELAFAGVTRILSESDVQARVTQATGTVSAILDVQAIEWAGGSLWAAVQSPSNLDGAVIQLNGTPQVIIDEAGMGLGGSEIDALAEMRTGDEIPCFQMSLDQALPGDMVHIDVHGDPNSILMVLMAGNTGFRDFSRFPGFGAWYLDGFDPWLRAQVATARIPFVQLDSTGTFSRDWRIPARVVFGSGFAHELGWSFQIVDVSDFELSAPFRVLKL